jgi:hypothetical protein
LQCQHAVQLGIPGAEIIDGNPCAGVTIPCNYIAQALAIATQLSDLENDTFGGNAVLLQLLQTGERLAGS